MSVKFAVYGPFKVPTQSAVKWGKRRYSVNSQAFWKNEKISEFAQCKGCYVFANASGPGFTPIYVGKTNKSFKTECFQSHKKTKLDGFLKDKGKSSLQIFFIVLENFKNYVDEKINMFTKSQDIVMLMKMNIVIFLDRCISHNMTMVQKKQLLKTAMQQIQ